MCGTGKVGKAPREVVEDDEEVEGGRQGER